MNDWIRLVGLFLVILNVVTVIIKLVAWQYSGSSAVLSEAINSIVDVVYSVLILAGIYISTKSSDDNYPEGYRRIEPFLSILIGFGIILTGGIVGYNSIESITSNKQATSSFVALLVLLTSVGLKIVMYKVCMISYKRTNSPVLSAVGIDNRNDILTIIIAIIGVTGTHYGVYSLDGYSAAVISVAIAYSGLEIIKENSGYALAHSVPDDVYENIVDVVTDHKKVNNVHDVQIHHSGPEIDISMHVEIPGNISVENSHQTEVVLANKIKESCDIPINEINLHMDPESLGEWE